jgi:hypothetical protein
VSIIVYPRDFSGLYEIANATSVQMSYYYNDIGKLILDVPINDDNVAALKNGRILYDTDKKLAYIIKNVKTDTTQNRITANGFTTNQMLNSRVIAAPAAFTKVEDGVYSVVNENLRGLPRIALEASKGLTENTNVVLYGVDLLDGIMPVLFNAGLGNRMTWNHRTKKHTFEIYKGKDMTTGLHAVVFSDEQGTARDLVIGDDASEFKNVAYVVTTIRQGDTETGFMEVVGTATGDDRHEMWVEASFSKEDGETDEQFLAKLPERMRTHGAMELGKRIQQLSFAVTVDPSELGVLYNVGDIVACVSKRFGVRFNARISGVKYKKDSRTDITEIILGELVLTNIGEENLSG